MASPARHPTTPDGRYFVVKGQLWRCSNPDLPQAVRSQWVSELMQARRAVKSAGQAQDDAAMRLARARVQAAKVALGERGPVWWADGAADYTGTRSPIPLTPLGTPRCSLQPNDDQAAHTAARRLR